MKTTITLESEKRDELVKHVISDSILWERTIKVMNQAQRIFEPTEEEWEAGNWFNGLYTAFPLLGIPDPETIKEEEEILPITNKLQEIFNRAIREDLQRDLEFQKRANDLADHIFLEWKAFIRDHDIQKMKEKIRRMKERV